MDVLNHVWLEIQSISHFGESSCQPSRTAKELAQLVKGHLPKTYRQHNMQWQKTERFPLKIRNKTSMFTLTSFAQHCTGDSSSVIKQVKRITRHPH